MLTKIKWTWIRIAICNRVFLRVGDKTTCGGQILTGDNTFIFYGASAAREGDMVTCGKHSGTYQIFGGISNLKNFLCRKACKATR
ncbi:PAAR domain-containing protein [Providencia sp. Me1]|uniref:PAAR domain-containing protein n=1 Tax=Providencia sp. Me1 TaxID=3392634 RepID=UPI003D2D7DDA